MLRPFGYLARVCSEDFVKNAVANNGLALEFVSGGWIQQAWMLAISVPKNWCQMVAGYTLSHLVSQAYPMTKMFAWKPLVKEAKPWSIALHRCVSWTKAFSFTVDLVTTYIEVKNHKKILVNHMMARLFHAERIKSHLMETWQTVVRDSVACLFIDMLRWWRGDRPYGCEQWWFTTAVPQQAADGQTWPYDIDIYIYIDYIAST